MYKRLSPLLAPASNLIKGGAQSQTTLGLNNSLEGFTELTKSCYFHRYGIRQGKGVGQNKASKDSLGSSPQKVPPVEFLSSSPHRITKMCYFPGIDIWQHPQSIATQGGSRIPFGVQSFYWSSITYCSRSYAAPTEGSS